MQAGWNLKASGYDEIIQIKTSGIKTNKKDKS